MSKKKDNRKRDAENKLERISKTCAVELVGDGQTFPLGEFTLTEIDPGPTIEQFADAAFKATRASLVRLRVPMYRLVVKDGQSQQGFGLERWVKLVDGKKLQEEHARKQRIRRGKLAA
jgi:hypothetical protein